jgi:hypothetical protein
MAFPACWPSCRRTTCSSEKRIYSNAAGNRPILRMTVGSSS